MPLCKNGPGGVGWLDMGCGGTLKDQIENPCNASLRHPDLAADAAPVTSTPSRATINDTRRQDDAHPDVRLDMSRRAVDRSAGRLHRPRQGNNLWYHIPRFAEFLLDTPISGQQQRRLQLSAGHAHSSAATAARRASRAGSCATSCRARWAGSQPCRWHRCASAARSRCSASSSSAERRTPADSHLVLRGPDGMTPSWVVHRCLRFTHDDKSDLGACCRGNGVQGHRPDGVGSC